MEVCYRGKKSWQIIGQTPEKHVISHIGLLEERLRSLWGPLNGLTSARLKVVNPKVHCCLLNHPIKSP